MSQEKNEKLGFSKKSSGVVLKDVTKIFQQPDTGKDFVAVDHINLEIKDGEMVTLLGPSASVRMWRAMTGQRSWRRSGTAS